MNWSRTLIAVTLTLMTPAASATTLNGRVVDIADGDTLTLLVDHRPYVISIAAIDAPERYQAWGDRSKSNLGRLSSNRAAVAHCSGVDRRGHHVCKLTVNNIDVGLEQIKDGMAWWVRNHANGLSAEDQSVYENTELMAKLKRQGLWRDTNPIPPWRFRGETDIL
ncbi:MAG: thermonuclease family protein [Thiobacillus sp.]